MPGLTGIRAFAVLAVIAYHSGLSWLPGGYHGVDVFFALSGYLITSLLVTEWRASSTISLRGFWERRARRLLPALFLLLIGVGICTAVFPAALAAPHLRSDAIATLFYVANWHFIAEHSNYFVATAQPSPLLHTWSLAIEEQFYILWPLIVLAVLGGDRARWLHKILLFIAPWRIRRQTSIRAARSRLKILLAVALAGASASVCAMVLTYHAGGDPTRAYYGTDTRAQSLLIGAALAIGLTLWNPVGNRRGRNAVGFAGAFGVAGCALTWTRVGSQSWLAFRGGFALCAVSAACVIASAALLPEGMLARVLSIRPIGYLGKISYGVYLWYWPTLLVVDRQETGLTGYPLLVLRVAIVLLTASLSYFVIEKPIRDGNLRMWRIRSWAPAGAATACATIFIATAVVAPPTVPVSLAAETSGAGTGPSRVDAAEGGPQAGSAALPAKSPTVPVTSPVKVLLVGDSLAGSLGVGLQEVQAEFGAQVVNDGAPGCSLGMDGDFRVLWYTVPPGPPCVVSDPGALLATWHSWVDSYDPDVVVYFARGDLMDQSVSGKWVTPGSLAYDTYLSSRLEAAIAVLAARGAQVVLLTSPYYDSGTKPDGTRWPEDQPSRVVAYNRVLAKVAATAGSGVSLVDLGAMLSPNASTSSALHGVTVRCSDGVHLTPQAGEWVGASLFPKLVAWGRNHARDGSRNVWLRYTLAPPTWYTKLICP